MPEGTVVCQLEEKTGDRGAIARASGKKQLKKNRIFKNDETLLSIGL